MKEKWQLLLFVALIGQSLAYNNLTLDENTIEETWATEGQCSAGGWGACFQGGALASFSVLIGDRYKFSKNARLVTTPLRSSDEEKRSTGDSGIFARLSKIGDDFIRSAGIELDLTPEMTENGRYQPRFVDEIYTELDTLELKHAKPNKQYELKKLFIPLLIVLKVFKLKLLLLLPIILGLASFKKLIAVAVVLLPAIIAYFKVCKPDLGQSYGSYGHSSFYNAPPSVNHQQYSPEGIAYDRMSYRNHGDRLAYRGYR